MCNVPISSGLKYCPLHRGYQYSRHLRGIHYSGPLKYSDFADSAKERNKKAVTTYRQRIKLKALKYKGNKCVICGYDRCSRALQFHHLDPVQKDFSVSRVTRRWRSIKPELDKCILVCANCHAEIHDGLL
jgi:hypothetical protein